MEKVSVSYPISAAILDDEPVRIAALKELDHLAAKELTELIDQGSNGVGEIERSIKTQNWKCGSCPDAVVVYTATVKL